ncbi:protein associated with UVRAG as autophagy enhancer isoform X2 [Egretta garzetta]|uniref:protein associated with UVRAG as autophagy enhancer isoform X2 n=1 Tax=Egretta garzetta TaxID=188379 RepID=UPI00163D19D3|nr:protein associated with UVRAG as autophagy enhancer isoform X2 [Egretta garzetta]
MSLHAVGLASYSSAEVFKRPCSEKINHESLKVAFTESAYSSNPSARISCLAPTPQISVLSDEFSRPAVIGHAGSFGSYPDSAEAIKDILMSVLNASGLKPSLVLEQTTMQGAEHLDSDMEQWEESSDGDSHDDSDSDSAHHNAACPASLLNVSAVPLNRALQDICMLPEDVEKENAHFFVADMIIASLEKMKYNILSQQAESWGVEETSGSDGSYHTDLELSSYPGVKKSDSSVASSDSGYEGCALLPVSSPVHLPSHHEVTRFHCHSDSEDEYVIIELEDLENLSVAPDERSSFEPGSNSAEATAQELCRAFRKHWLQTDSAVQLSGCLSTSKQRSVLKEEIPRELESSLNLAEEIKIISKLRGSSGWAPPRSQIIFNIHPSVKRDAVVAAQNFTCVGCGTPIENKYIRRLRYCDYLGKYFCDCCHSYAQSSIPARILMKWDFKKYYVCNFSKHLLDSIWQHPIFNVSCINKTLYTKSKEMDRVREAQEQLFHLKKLLKTCRFGESVLKGFEQVPSHLTEELHLFSLDDLVKIKRGQLLPLLKDILKSSTSHVDGCELCQAKGFICEFCQSADLLFPHQIAKCKRCTECKTCFHKACFKAGGCPKCLRITARRMLSETSPLVPP